MLAISAAKNALFLLKRNPLQLLVSIIIDSFALFLFGFLSAPVYAKLTEHVIIIGTLVSQKMNASRTRSVLSMLSDSDSSGFVKQLFLLLFLLLAIAYVIFVLSQGVNFALAKSITGRKSGVRSEIFSFAVIAGVWAAVVGIFYILNMLATLRASLLSKIAPNTGTGLVDVLEAMEAALLFIAIVSFASGGVMKGFAWIRNNKTDFLASALLATLVFLAVNILMQAIGRISADLIMLGGFFIFLPAIAWLRVFIVELVKA